MAHSRSRSQWEPAWDPHPCLQSSFPAPAAGSCPGPENAGPSHPAAQGHCRLEHHLPLRPAPYLISPVDCTSDTHIIDPLFPPLPTQAGLPPPPPCLLPPKWPLLMHPCPCPPHSTQNQCLFQNAHLTPSLSCLKHYNGSPHPLRAETKILPRGLPGPAWSHTVHSGHTGPLPVPSAACHGLTCSTASLELIPNSTWVLLIHPTSAQVSLPPGSFLRLHPCLHSTPLCAINYTALRPLIIKELLM